MPIYAKISMVVIMKYLTCSEVAGKWNISERSVRNYCSNGRVVGAILKAQTAAGSVGIIGGADLGTQKA